MAGAVGASMMLGLVGSNDAGAYVVKRTSRGELVHWETPTVAYTLDPSLDGNVATGAAATVQAMGDWGGTVGAPDLHVRPQDQDSPKKPGFDQKNGIFYMANGWAPAGRALAITVLTYDNATGRILDADIIFNGSYKFAVLTEEGHHPHAAPQENVVGTRPSAATDGISHTDQVVEANNVYDLHHVIAHELGHSLGMNDEMGRRDALMYRYSAPNDATMRAPADDDIQGLAELYSTRLEAGGNGCGNASVAPKKPSLAASHVAMFATLGFLLFLVLRGRSDRRARFAFVAAAAVATYGLFPSVSSDGKSGGISRDARASELAPGHARAKVLSTTTSMEEGLLKTTYKLATTACRAATCPKLGHGSVWGGTSGNIRQDVGGQFAPTSGDDVDVSFAKLPSALAPLSSVVPSGRADDGDVTVLTQAN
ncbi:MAG: matrixin family metalloprotease [Labilithrix sp.]|nr:matrixin family metalloprotease [Labilithrix sp.]